MLSSHHVRIRHWMPVLCVLWAGASGAAETHRYDWITAGRVTGELTVRLGADGRRETRFHYADRGRGPELREVIEIDGQGRLQRLSIRGTAYMGTPVDERFEREADHASWRTTFEKGSTDQAGEAFYLPAEGSPELTAMVARALLATPQRRLSVLPDGEAVIAALDDTTVGPPGRKRHATLYAISGLDLTPTWVWLDDRRELLALSGGGFGLVPEGWVEWLPELVTRQQAAEQRHAASLASSLTRQLPDEYAIENVGVVDVVRGRVLRNRTVVLRDGLIARVARRLPDDFEGESMDGEDGYLVPGLWDMHVHIGLSDGLQHIAAGVTTVRDLGNSPQDLLQIREAFETGSAIGPGIVAAGVVEGRSPYSAPIGRLPVTEAEALDLVREYAGLGYAQIKIYSSLDPGWVPAVAAESHRLGMRLSGHVPQGMNAEQAVLAGYDEIQHIYMLFLNFLASPAVDTRTPARFTVVADHAAELGLDSSPVQSFIDLLVDRGTVIDPTLAICEDMFTQAPGQIAPSLATVAERLPPGLRRQLLLPRLNKSVAEATARTDDFQALLDMVGLLYRRGVPLVAGTDAMPGFTLHRELELYAKAGIPDAEVLRLATLGAARAMGLEAQTGSIEAGKQADLVLLDANPLKNISAVRGARLVVRGRNAWLPARLYTAEGVRPQ